MKNLLLFSVTLLFFASCSSQKQVSSNDAGKHEINLDTTSYEITIIEPDFDRWYLMRFNPGLDRSNEYYRSKNSLAASTWNSYYNSGRYRRAISSDIPYNPSVDYGIEVNRKLYWYFKYIEENYKVPLLR